MTKKSYGRHRITFWGREYFIGSMNRIWWFGQPSMAAVTNFHNIGCLRNQKLIVLWFWRTEVQCQGIGWATLLLKALEYMLALPNSGHSRSSLVCDCINLNSSVFTCPSPLISSCFSAATAAAKSHQSCPTLCDPMDSSPPGSPIPGILQARTLEWVAISFSNAWKWKIKVKSLIHVWLLATPWTAAYQAPLSMGFSRQG